MKNIERIRKMNSNELAELIASDCLYCIYKDTSCLCEGECELGIQQWLEQEVEE